MFFSRNPTYTEVRCTISSISGLYLHTNGISHKPTVKVTLKISPCYQTAWYNDRNYTSTEVRGKTRYSGRCTEFPIDFKSKNDFIYRLLNQPSKTCWKLFPIPSAHSHQDGEALHPEDQLDDFRKHKTGVQWWRYVPTRTDFSLGFSVGSSSGNSS